MAEKAFKTTHNVPDNTATVREVRPTKPLVQITGRSLDDEKAKLVRNDLEAAISSICEKHGLTLSRFIAKRVDDGELSLAIRCSERNGLGFDSLTRDLLNYCGKLGFKPAIMNASIIIQDKEHLVNGVDVSCEPYTFRLMRVEDAEHVFCSADFIKKALPGFFA